MRTIEDALVIGLGKSGLAAAHLLLHRGARVSVYDRRPDAEVPQGARAFVGVDAPPDEAFEGIDTLVLSPGVPPGRFVERVRALAPRARIEGELSLALQSLPGRPRTVLITGTNGKSTVTALTGKLLEAGGEAPFVGGNLGDPVAELVTAVARGEREPPTTLVVECSSYQLETLPSHVSRTVGMVLNVTPDHLDRYPDLQTYAATKAKVFEGMDATGLALIDADGPWTRGIVPPSGVGLPRVEQVGRAPGPRLEHRDGEAHLVLGDDSSYPRALLRLPGTHNAINALFALSAARHLGVTPERCSEGLQAFEGLPHRMAWVRELDGVDWYDDSKATNVASALASLGGLERPFVLIAGGQAKGDDLTPLGRLIAERARGLVAIGESASSFAALAGSTPTPTPTKIAGSMEEAVEAARQLAQKGDVVVLAPACASFDWFTSYAHRGQVFQDAVRALG